MSGIPGALLLAVAGLLAGVGIHLLNQRLCDAEEEAVGGSLWHEEAWAPTLAAAALGWIGWRHGLSLATAVRCAVALVLVQVLVFDARHRLILNRVIYPAVLLALVLSPVNPMMPGSPWIRALSAVAAALACGGVFLVLVLVSRGGVGLGDAKLAFFMGAALGLLPASGLPAVHATVWGVLLGGVTAGVLLVTRVRGMRDFIPYGPFLCVGGVLALVYPCGLGAGTACS